jgi:hypothetical protein
MIETIKEYASKRIDLLKIEATEKSSLSAGLITYFVVLLVAFAFFIILFNFGIAFLIGKALDNYFLRILNCCCILFGNGFSLHFKKKS